MVEPIREAPPHSTASNEFMRGYMERDIARRKARQEALKAAGYRWWMDVDWPVLATLVLMVVGFCMYAWVIVALPMGWLDEPKPAPPQQCEKTAVEVERP